MDLRYNKYIQPTQWIYIDLNFHEKKVKSIEHKIVELYHLNWKIEKKNMQKSINEVYFFN